MSAAHQNFQGWLSSILLTVSVSSTIRNDSKCLGEIFIGGASPVSVRCLTRPDRPNCVSLHMKASACSSVMRFYSTVHPAFASAALTLRSCKILSMKRVVFWFAVDSGTRGDTSLIVTRCNVTLYGEPMSIKPKMTLSETLNRAVRKTRWGMWTGVG